MKRRLGLAAVCFCCSCYLGPFSLPAFAGDGPIRLTMRPEMLNNGNIITVYEVQSLVDSIDILNCSRNRNNGTCTNTGDFPYKLKYGDKKRVHTAPSGSDNTLDMTIDTDQGEFTFKFD